MLVRRESTPCVRGSAAGRAWTVCCFDVNDPRSRGGGARIKSFRRCQSTVIGSEEAGERCNFYSGATTRSLQRSVPMRSVSSSSRAVASCQVAATDMDSYDNHKNPRLLDQSWVDALQRVVAPCDFDRLYCATSGTQGVRSTRYRFGVRSFHDLDTGRIFLMQIQRRLLVRERGK